MSTEGADDVVLDPSSVSEIIKQGANVAIPTLGFYYEHDATLGAKTSAMIKRRIDCQSREGLDFYEANILNDSRVQDILDSFFPPSSRIVMARYRNFAHDPNHIFQYRAGASNGLFEAGYGDLQKAGCEGTEVEFEHGGLIEKGALNAAVFATDEIAKRWPHMILLDTPDIRRKATEITEAPAGGANVPSHFKRRPGLHAQFKTS
ncbi:hypothetical protein UCDDA912_g08345 [Diaporthe ampelina]|uniref:Uncharacterized protein n=1 Tax=Diaporthe ampelina TaxID=1214573 RepID=A0A0G2FAJ7_9PEZI|nr:hypothetical protein UCDDA912_g08345 [Diaporthe ampelina]